MKVRFYSPNFLFVLNKINQFPCLSCFLSLLENSLNTSKIKSQDAASVLGVVAGNRNGLLQAWRFLRQKWDFLIERSAFIYSCGGNSLSLFFFSLIQIAFYYLRPQDIKEIVFWANLLKLHYYNFGVFVNTIVQGCH